MRVVFMYVVCMCAHVMHVRMRISQVPFTTVYLWSAIILPHAHAHLHLPGAVHDCLSVVGDHPTTCSLRLHDPLAEAPHLGRK